MIKGINMSLILAEVYIKMKHANSVYSVYEYQGKMWVFINFGYHFTLAWGNIINLFHVLIDLYI